MLKENAVTWQQRAKELSMDYLCILLYLLMVLGLAMGVYFFALNGIPDFREWQSHVMALAASVVPVVLIFSVLDYTKGSLGKQKAGLRLYYRQKTFGASLLRNIVKFSPWQLGHAGVIHGMYTGFDTAAILLSCGAMALALGLLIMGLARRDKRHLGDLIAGTQVQAR